MSKEFNSNSLSFSGKQFDQILNLSVNSQVASEHLQSVLIEPVNGISNRPSKRIRRKLVEIGYLIAGGKDGTLAWQPFGDLIESLHTGSLVVDDIQDQSEERRGAPTLHQIVGVPLALNAGNWLYFYPMDQVSQMNLPPEQEIKVYRSCHRTLVRAHFGQALDLGVVVTQISQDQIYELTYSALELKSGALMALGFGLGAISADAEEEFVRDLEDFGHRFGVALQMFDDIGNFIRPGKKQFEDLSNKRLSWFWATASKTLDEKNYRELVRLVEGFPGTKNQCLGFIKESKLIEQALQQANAHLDESLKLLKGVSRESNGYKLLKELADKLRGAYV